MQSKVKVTGKVKVQGHILGQSSYGPFHSMLIDPPNIEIQLVQNLTLKIQGQDHGWGQSSRSNIWSSILSTCINFIHVHQPILEK